MYIHVCPCAYVRVRVYLCAGACPYAGVRVCKFFCVVFFACRLYAYACVLIHVHVCVSAKIHVCACMYVCACVSLFVLVLKRAFSHARARMCARACENDTRFLRCSLRCLKNP